MSTKVGNFKASQGAAGFTMVEMMVATTLAILLIVAVLSSFGYVTRTQYSIANYCKMDQQARKALELIGRDIKQANPTDSSYPMSFSGSTGGTHVMILGIPSATNAASSAQVKYTYNSGTLTRELTDNGVTTSQKLATNITSFALSGSSISNVIFDNIEQIAANKSVVKQIQLQMTLQIDSIRRKLTGDSSQAIISAQYSIRK